MPLDEQILQRLRDNDATLTSLDLGYKQINDAGAEALGEALQINNTLISLDLTGNQISDAGAEVLGEALQINNTLIKLNLFFNQISAAGMKALGEALQKNITLTSLQLGSNQIRDAGTTELAQALQKNTTLTSLGLSSNQISDAGVKALGEMLSKNNKLSVLNLNSNSIGDQGLKELGKGLEKNAALSELILWGDRATNQGTKVLVEKLVNNNSILKLNLTYCEISDAVTIQKDKLLKRNLKLLRAMQVIACKLLSLHRVLNFKVSPISDRSLLQLPLEIREHIISYCDEHKLLTAGQKKKIALYAQGNTAPVADKLKFFVSTDCNRVMKKIGLDKIQQLAPDDGVWDTLKESFTSGMQFLSEFPWVVPKS